MGCKKIFSVKGKTPGPYRGKYTDLHINWYLMLYFCTSKTNTHVRARTYKLGAILNFYGNECLHFYVLTNIIKVDIYTLYVCTRGNFQCACQVLYSKMQVKIIKIFICLCICIFGLSFEIRVGFIYSKGKLKDSCR